MSFRQMFRALWPASVEQLTAAEVARLADELEGRYARMLRRRRKIERLRDRLTAMAKLGRGDLADRLRDRLAEQEEAYERQRLAFDRAKALRRAMAGGLVVAMPVSDDEA